MFDGFIKVATCSPVIHPADVSESENKIARAMLRAAAGSVKVLVLPELCLTGYTAADLFLQQTLQSRALGALSNLLELSRQTDDMVTLIGSPLVVEGRLYNCAILLQAGKILGIVPKQNLPNYQEFYEKRWFSVPAPGNRQINLLGQDVPFGTKLVFACQQIKDLVLGIEICEDLWVPLSPSLTHVMAGATMILNPSATDDLVSKDEYRRKLVCMQSAKCISGYVYAGAGCGESSTDLVFTGHSLICENGTLLAESMDQGEELTVSVIDVQKLALERRRMTTFFHDVEGYRTVSFDMSVEQTDLSCRAIATDPFVPDDDAVRQQRCEKILGLQAQGLCTRLQGAHCSHAVIGLSGGLDSTLALLVTVRAFRRAGFDLKGIHAVSMPCFGTTGRTRTNSMKLATALGVDFREIDITKAVRQHFKDIGQDEQRHDVTYENCQARERTQVLMDLSNKVGGLVVGTGDLSELALGWATYNGDHMSMYGVNASVPKTLVRHLVSYVASIETSEISQILLDIIDTPVSPELLPPTGEGTISQKTEDLVGPYILHDFFLYYFVRWGFSLSKISRLATQAFEGQYAPAVVNHWLSVFIKRFFQQQFKRSALPDGPKVGSVTLSPRGDWRMPSDAPLADWKNFRHWGEDQ
ncbi:MAG: NAD(+) synthase [Spirochaetia bacterium]|jgi:NAD+ synthase (glutamine-hydrolysing)|nr:NAD(+) synthase [Spirochaetia bacterium]